ncbi:MAG TPA: hypothetical protein VLK88_02765 [Gemmatimonadales bacterium]|nr:hypothetical protein [Gemmatimonadales bacterium]
MKFFIGVHTVSDAHRFSRSMVSLNRLRTRKSDFRVNEWILDSGVFTDVLKYGRHRTSVEDYATVIKRWARCGTLAAAVTQDWMCEPVMLARTGLTVAEHQRRTIEGYDQLVPLAAPVPILPVLQGWRPADYVAHVRAYGPRLAPGAWVGIGSVCKRNNSPGAIEQQLLAIHAIRPDLRLHGFGVKTTALRSGLIRSLLWSSDSMAWSFAARYEGRNQNHWSEAANYVRTVVTAPVRSLPLWEGEVS